MTLDKRVDKDKQEDTYKEAFTHPPKETKTIIITLKLSCSAVSINNFPHN